jgi:hypothetical protein
MNAKHLCGWPAIVAFLAIAVFGLNLASAEIIFKSDFETGDFSQWGGKKMTKMFSEYQNLTERNAQIVSDFVPPGAKHAVKMTIHPDDKFGKNQLRVQLGGPNIPIDEDSHIRVSFWLAMKDPPKDRDNIIGWEGSPGGSVMKWWVEPKEGGGTLVKFGIGNLGKDGIHWIADFPIGKWHQLAMDVTWSFYPDKGNVKCWFDGEVVLDKEMKTRYNLKQFAVYCQPGIMRGPPPGMSEDTLYLANFIAATTVEELQIIKPAAPSK